MRKWIDVGLLLALVVVTTITAITALPALGDHDAVRGDALRTHMLASGVLAVGLPILAIWFLGRGVGGSGFSVVGRVGYWTLLTTGWLTIASVYFCMVPVASTEQMDELIELHGYTGWAMCAATALLLLGLRRRSPQLPKA